MTQDSRTGPKPPQWMVLLAFGAIYLLWGSTYLGIRIAIETIPPFLMAGSRYLTAGLVLYAIVWMTGERAPKPVHWRNTAVVGILLLLLQNAVITWVELKTPSGLTALVVAATPFWTILIEWMFVSGTRLKMSLILGMLLGFAGVGVIVFAKNEGGSNVIDPLHLGLIVAGSIFWSVGVIYSRQSRMPANALQGCAMQMISGGAIILLFSFVSGDAARFRFGAVSHASWMAFAYLAVFGSLVGYSAYMWLLKVSTVAKVSTTAFVNPLVAVILGATVAREPFSPGILLAAVLIIGAVMLITWKRAKPGRREA